jgi:geranylgeranyl diphosphate synthase type I
MAGQSRDITEFYFGWRDEHGDESDVPSTRKRLGTLVLLAAGAAGGGRERALPAAVACELAYCSVIILDDIADGDRIRRGKPSVWSLFGVPAAVFASSSLDAAAFEELCHGEVSARESFGYLSRAIQDTNNGQMLDSTFERRRDVGLDECMDMYAAKASSFGASACALGALGADADEVQVKEFAKLGGRVGLSWQLYNDLLGIWGDPADTGKTAFPDLVRRK